jgi:hypothetical protein
LFLPQGEALHLVCQSNTPPSSDNVTITWYHNGAPINPEAVTLTPSYRRLGIRNAKLISALTVPDVDLEDSGRYMCVRSQGRADEERDLIDVVVTSRLERPTTVQSKRQSATIRYYSHLSDEGGELVKTVDVVLKSEW